MITIMDFTPSLGTIVLFLPKRTLDRDEAMIMIAMMMLMDKISLLFLSYGR
jgi:hypothetical protein